MLPVILLPVGDDGFGLPELVEHQDQLPSLDLLDFAGEQLTHLVAELLADLAPLPLADPLNDPLLGGLYCQPPEFGKGDLLFEHVPGFKIGSSNRASSRADLCAGILDLLDDRSKPHDPHSALKLIDIQVEPDVGTELASQRRVNSVTQQLEQVAPIQLFGCGQLAKRGQHFGGTSHCVVCSWGFSLARCADGRGRKQKCGGAPHITSPAD